MAKKSGPNIITGGNGNEHLNGGSGDDVINGMGGNDRINAGSGNDIIDGGAGDDIVSGDAGDDLGIYVLGENRGSRDVYDGGSGIDTLKLVMTRAEWESPAVQADIARYLVFLARVIHPTNGQAKNEDFTFSFGLTASKFENLRIVVDGIEMDPRDEAVTLVDDVMVAGEDTVSVAVDVLLNDSVPDLIASLTNTQPSHGSVTLTRTSGAPVTADTARFVYTPDASHWQYLAAGETATDTFTYTVTDADGDVQTATVTVTITGSNDAPTISAAVSTGAVVEDGAVTASGTIAFADVDLSDTHSVSSNANGAGYLGTFTAVVTDDSTGDGAGSVSWEFAVDNAAIQYLAAGETLTQTYTVTIDDGEGGTVDQTVTVTITGTNDVPTIIAAVSSGAVIEDGAVTASGAIAFADVDLRDGHAVSSQADAAGYLGTFNATLTDDSTGDGAGSVTWDFAVDNTAIQYLAAGETLTQTYTVTVDDGQGGTVDQTVTVTITGTNDTPTITAAQTTGRVQEADPVTAPTADVTPVLADSESNDDFASAQVIDRTLLRIAPNANLADATDPSISIQGNIATNADQDVFRIDLQAGEILTLDVDFASGLNGVFGLDSFVFVYDAAGNLLNFNDDSSTAAGGGGSTRTQDSFLQFIAGQTGTFYIVVKDFDLFGQSSAGAYTLQVSVDSQNLQLTDTGVITFADVDLADGHTVSVSAEGSGYLGGLTAVIADASAGDGAGAVTWNFNVANAAVQFLAAGETRTQTYTVTVDDGQGGTASETVSITITGENDGPVITTAFSSGQVTEGSSVASSGVIAFNDVDLIDGHAVTSSAEGAGYLGVFTANVSNASTGDGSGEITWSFVASDAELQFLAQGQSLLQRYVVTLDDGNGGTTQQLVNITITGTNDAPTIEHTATIATASVTELADGAAGENASTLSAAGSIAFADVDISDTHTASVSPQADNYLGVLTLGGLDQAGNSVGWSFSVDDAALDFLGAGETRTQDYTVAISDGNGGTVEQTVSITLTGTNDAPTVISSVSHVFSFSDSTNSSQYDGTNYSFQEAGFDFDGFYDYPYGYGADGGGMTYTYGSSNWSVGGSDGTISRLDGANFGIRSFSVANFSSSSTATINGYIDGVLVATQTFEVNAQHQTITLNAAFGNVDEVRFDAPQNDYIFLDEIVIGTNGTTANLAELAEGSAGAGTAVISTAGTSEFQDVDISDFHTATATAQGTNYIGGLVIDGVDQDTNTVNWTFSANDGDLDFLAAGETRSQSYTINVDDGQGGSVDQTVTVTLTGSNDAPTITAAATDATGAIVATPVDPAVVVPPAPISFLVEQFTGFQSNDLNTLRNYAATHTANYTATTGVIDFTDDPAGFSGELPGSSPWPAAVATGQSGTGGINDVFFARITSVFSVTTADTYTFRTFNDDGVYLMIDGVIVIADSGYHPEQAYEGSITLTPGNHTIELFFFENGGEASLELSVRNSTGSFGLLGGTGGGLGGAINMLTDSGEISFADVDLIDGHTVSSAADAPGYLGNFTAVVTDNGSGDGAGTVTWTFAVDNAALEHLAAGETVTQTYTVTVSDGQGGTVSQPVTVTLTGVNEAPVAVANVATTNEDASVTIDVLANDTDVDGDTLSVTQVNGTNIAVNGTVALGDGASVRLNADGTLTYVPAANATGLRSFSYTTSDGQGGTATASVEVNLTPVNDAPIGRADAAATNEDTALVLTASSLLVNDTDVDGDALSIASVSAVSARGASVSINAAGDVVYNPAVSAELQALSRGQQATDSFTYVVTDPAGASSTVTVTITVDGRLEAPVANPDSVTVSENGTVSGNVVANDIVTGSTDNSGNVLTNGSFEQGNPVSPGGITFPGSLPGWTSVQGSFEVWGDGFLGNRASDGIAFLELDNGGGQDAYSSNLTTDVGREYTLDFDLALRNGTAPASNQVEFFVNGVSLGVFTPPSTTFTTFTVTFIGSGSDVITFREPASANDGVGGLIDNLRISAPADVFVTAVNGDAGAVGDSVEGSSGGTFVIDADGDYVFTAGSDFDHLAAGETATSSVSYTVNDAGGSSTSTVTVTVTGEDDAPILARALADQSGDMLSPFSYTVASDTFTDVDSALTLSATLANGNPLPSWLSFDAASRTFSGTPLGADAGQLQVRVTATGHGQSVSDVFQLDVDVVDQTFIGGAGNDTLNGDVGDDIVVGGNGSDMLHGGAGNDVISGDAQNVSGVAVPGQAPLTTLAASYYTANHNLVTGLGGPRGFGEGVFARNDDGSIPINITSVFGAAGLDFFGNSYTSLFLNNNGNITFNTGFSGFNPSSISAGIGNPLIAAFWTDVDTRNAAGQTSPGGTSQGTNLVYYDLDAANGVITFTWDDVGQFSNGTAPNAFQIQLINRGNGDFDIIYRYEDITWGTNARAGYNSGTGTTFEFAQSGTAAMLDLEGTTGNTGIPGVYVFNVRDGVVSTANNDILNGGAGSDRLIGGLGDDTFVFDAGEANGDVIADFIGNGAAAGDTLVFRGYGTAAEGATFVQIDSTHWQITSADGQIREVITLENGAVIHASDFQFVGDAPAASQRLSAKGAESSSEAGLPIDDAVVPANASEPLDPPVLPAERDGGGMELAADPDFGPQVQPQLAEDDFLTLPPMADKELDEPQVMPGEQAFAVSGLDELFAGSMAGEFALTLGQDGHVLPGTGSADPRPVTDDWFI